ncbi:MAG: hypothetical protein HOV80_35660 [Polyangiaceae bacterium]|nr:hypothetical protein [Polyangiaceae bacterium]
MVLAGPHSSSFAKTFAVALRALGRRVPTGGGAESRPATAAAPSASDPALDPFRKTLLATLRQVSRPTRALVFVSGTPTPAGAIAEALSETSRNLDAIVVPSAGILTEGGELEGVPAVSGVVFGGRGGPIVSGGSAEDVAEKLGATRNVLTFHAAEGFDSAEVDVLSKGRSCVFGAGAPGASVWVVRGGRVDAARIAAVGLDGGAPIVESTPACKLVSEPLEVTEMDRSFILKLGGEPALDVLSSKAGGGRYGGLVLIAVHDEAEPSRFLVRPLRGIDPGRKAIAAAGQIAVGDKISFAVRDATAARDGLTETARRAERQALGSTPTFALYLSCAGRGRALYGEPDGDVRVLRKRFPRIPMAGMHSAFEIVPWSDGSARMQLMSGVLALFRAAS